MRSNAIKLIIGFVMLLWASHSAMALTLSEIMFNPVGDENSDEYIELLNETGQPQSLLGWLVADAADTDSVVALKQGLLVQPGQYVLILDPDYLEDSSTTYDGRIPADAIVVTIDNSTFGSRGLSNSEVETVSLIGPGGAAISACTYTLDNLPGYSEERINSNGPDSLALWSNSRVLHGTPGGHNSVSPWDHDLDVTKMWTEPVAPEIGHMFQLKIRVANTGLQPTSDSLRLFQLAAEGPRVRLTSWRVIALAPGDSVDFGYSVLLTNPLQGYQVELAGPDDNASNNGYQLAVSAAGAPGLVVINEIMYNPEPQMCEWVELLNGSPFTWNLNGWRFGDGTALTDTTRFLVLPDLAIPPQSYVILADDSSILFDNVPSQTPCIFWGAAPISLNNNGDSLILQDPSGRMLERVDYRPSWGDNRAGISLERISLGAATNDRLNWSASLDSTGATPGRPNSRTLQEGTAGADLLTIEPNPFTPDGDGRDDRARIRYQLEHADSRLDLKIYDARGREVRCLANGEPAGLTGEKLWDGTDGNGEYLPTGLYIIYLEALGRGGSRVQSAKRAVALARRS